MATRRPIKWDYTLNGFKEWSDSEIGALKYNLAVAFGDYLNSGGIGAVGGVSTGTGKADIYNPAGGSTTDTRRNAASNSNTAGGGGGTDYPGYPSTTVSTISSSRWQQNLDSVGMPSATTITDHSFLYYKGSGYQFQYINAEIDFLDTIVYDAISIMRTGHEVGTYRVATGTPSNGGSGTWTDKGVVFTDTTYNAGSTTYRLYLKRNLSDPSPYAPSSPTSHRWTVGGTSQGFHPQDISTGSSLIQNVLLPILKRHVSGGGRLEYRMGGTNNGTNRGSMSDRRQEGSSTSQNYSNPNYFSHRTPSGGASNITNYYFKLI